MGESNVSGNQEEIEGKPDGIMRESGWKIERACSDIKNVQQLKQMAWNSISFFIFNGYNQIEWRVTCEIEKKNNKEMFYLSF